MIEKIEFCKSILFKLIIIVLFRTQIIPMVDADFEKRLCIVFEKS